MVLKSELVKEERMLVLSTRYSTHGTAQLQGLEPLWVP